MTTLFLVRTALLSAALTTVAVPTWARPSEVLASAEAHDRAAKLKPLAPGDEGQVRVWLHTPMSGQVYGYVVGTRGGQAFKGTSIYRADRGETIKLRMLKKSLQVKSADLQSHLRQLMPYARKELACGVMDGYSVIVQFALDGRKVTLSAANPEHCRDDGSKATFALLKAMGLL